MKKLLLILLLLPISGWGTIRTLTSASLPYTTQAAGDTIRFATDSIGSNTNGIIINHANVLIDGQDNILGFNIGQASSNYAIYINAANCTIRNLWILQDENGGDACDGILFTHGGYGATIQGVKIKMYGTNNINCVDSYGGGTQIYNITMDTCQFWNYSKGYTSRAYYDGAAVRLESRRPGLTDNEWSIHMRGNRVHISPHVSYAIHGNSTSTLGAMARRADIRHCTTGTEHQNTVYSEWDGTIGHSSANCYGFLLADIAGLTLCSNYVVTRDTADPLAAGGCRGFDIESVRGTAENPNMIFDNYVNIRVGPDVEYDPDGDNIPPPQPDNGYFPGWVFRMRSGDNNFVPGGRYTNVFDNHFEITLDTASHGNNKYPKTFFGHGSATIHISEQQNTPELSHFNIYNNTCIINANNVYTTTGQHVYGYSVMFSFTDEDTTIKFWGNNFTTPSTFLNLEYGSGLVFLGDTFTYGAQTDQPKAIILGVNGVTYYSENNIVRDCYFSNNAYADTNIIIANMGEQDITIQENLLLYVMGNNDSLVSSATVWRKNAYGDSVVIGSTGDSGYVWAYTTYWYESRTETDLTAFNDFTVGAHKSGDSTNQSLTIGQNFVSDTIYLANTSGDIGGEEPPEEPAKYLLKGIKR